VPKLKIILTGNQWKKVSDISGSAGLLTVASMIIPFLTPKIDLFEIIKGIVVTAFLWYISILTAGKYND